MGTTLLSTGPGQEAAGSVSFEPPAERADSGDVLDRHRLDHGTCSSSPTLPDKNRPGFRRVSRLPLGVPVLRGSGWRSRSSCLKTGRPSSGSGHGAVRPVEPRHGQGESSRGRPYWAGRGKPRRQYAVGPTGGGPAQRLATSLAACRRWWKTPGREKADARSSCVQRFTKQTTREQPQARWQKHW